MFVCERNTEYLDAISRLKVIDDDFMRIVFKDKECLTQFLEIILERPIEIIEWHVQYDINNILGRSISIDVFVKTENHYINIEVQRDYTGANPRRARFHGSLIDASTSYPKEEWKDLPHMIIIFITEEDVLGYGLPIYHVHRTIDENNQIFDDGSEIIYINASIQEDNALGRLMHDFLCSETSDMHYEFLRKRVSYFKETEGGRKEMCEIWEEIKRKGKQEGIQEGIIEGEARGEMKGMVKSIQKLMSKKGYTLEEAFNFFDIPEEERSIYIQKIIS